MKYILPIISLLLISCSSSNDKCDCTQQRWERIAEYQGTSQTIVAATPWNGMGTEEPIGSNDCSLDATLGSAGVQSSTVQPNGNTRKEEYEYRITCY